MVIKGQSVEGWLGDIEFTNDVSDADDNGIAIYGGNTLALSAQVDSGSNDYAIKIDGIGIGVFPTSNDFDFNVNTEMTASQDVLMEKDLRLVDGKITIDQQVLTDASTITWNLSDGSNARVTLGGNRTLSITNINAGDTGVILVKQGTGTTHNLTLPASSVIIGGTTYTTTTTSGGTDVLGVYFDGNNYYWSIPGGATGAQGITGTKGAQGITGTKGAQGITGTKGAQGIQGIQGITGTKGAQGITGTKGAQGITGTKGAQGITGTKGAQGITGIGSPGTKGAQGITGTKGAQGTNPTTPGSNNQVLTSDGSGGMVAESGLTFDGLNLYVAKLINLGNASDTSLARSTAGVMSVEGDNVVVTPSSGTSNEFAAYAGSNSIKSIDTFNYLPDPGFSIDKFVITGSLGVGTGAPINNTAGRITATNDIVAYASSDKRLKENIRPIPWAVDKVKQINGVYFDWIPLSEEEEKTIHGNKGEDIGVIAQEIEAVLPELVTTRDNGYKAVKYDKIVALLIEAIKEQQGEIEELRRKIK